MQKPHKKPLLRDVLKSADGDNGTTITHLVMSGPKQLEDAQKYGSCFVLPTSPVNAGVQRPEERKCHGRGRSYEDSPAASLVLLLRQTSENALNISNSVKRVVELSLSVRVKEVVVLIQGAGMAHEHAELMRSQLKGPNHFLLYTPARLNFLQALERAVSSSRGERVLILDSSSVDHVTTDCLGGILESLKAGSRLGLVATRHQ
ncbi:hypothetical protein CYMTET_46432, partial [Cymbomonas tetramitiformis]